MDTLNLTKSDLKFLLVLSSLAPIVSFAVGIYIANSPALAYSSPAVAQINREPQNIQASHNSPLIRGLIADDNKQAAITKRYIVQAGLFSNSENANKLSKSLTEKQVAAKIVSDNKNGSEIFRVIVGSFESEYQAKSYLDNIEKTHAIKLYVTTINSSKASNFIASL